MVQASEVAREPAARAVSHARQRRARRRARAASYGSRGARDGTEARCDAASPVLLLLKV
jgi:hypothetical protein